ncbi:PSP1 [Trypanosoma melophagium]|uniref:PSP1 n=1 Tax=Trypanosoma melophagium TaxID=715481 RepID=UPI003519F434|nr:PSP1 [Trypanosoma melophagium]
MPGRELYQYYSHFNDQGSPHGLTSGAVNFFLATADNYTQQTIERTAHWNTFAQQPTSTAVYGPSKPPRLQQFVDLASNVCSMTPFFSLGGDITVGEREGGNGSGSGQGTQGDKQQEESEVVNSAVYAGQAFKTPQQQKKDRLPMSLMTPTPSSAMGMTVSPATACRDLHQMTSAQTVMCGNSVNTTTATSSTDNTNTITVEMRSRTQIQKMNTAPAVVVMHSNSLTNELESAFQEHRMRKNTRGMLNHDTEEKGKEEQEEEVEEEDMNNNTSNNTMEGEESEETTDMMVSANTGGKTSDTVSTSPISVSCDDNSADSKRRTTLTRREERTTQRRNKDQRHGKSKNNGHANSQRHNNQQNKNNSNNSDNITRSLLVSLANCDNAGSMGDGKKYMLNLLCHGDRKVTVVSFLELHAGDHVLFEGDRGVDLGEVIGCEETVNESTGVNKGNERGVLHMVRCATEEEVEEWKGGLVKKEEEAVIECREACQELGLTIHVAGAAFQFDRQKLIFLYESDERVDFRALLQVMFSKYRCRIWMERINAPS